MIERWPDPHDAQQFPGSHGVALDRDRARTVGAPRPGRVSLRGSKNSLSGVEWAEEPVVDPAQQAGSSESTVSGWPSAHAGSPTVRPPVYS